MRELFAEWFWSHVDKSDGCWLWRDRVGTRSYGQVSYEGRRRPATHVSLMLEGIDVPSGMFVCHSCDNPPCVRPDHLWLGTQADNLHDMQAKGRKFYPVGELHPNAKFTWGDIVAIRAGHAAGISNADLARQYGMDAGNLSRVVRGLTWRA